MRKALLLFLITLTAAGAVIANSDWRTPNKPISDDPIIGPNSPLPAPEGLPAPYHPANMDTVIGQVFIFGTTWYDIQHNCTCGRQLQVDDEGWIHLAWMNGLDNGATQRHIFYQLMDPFENLSFPGGVQVDQMNRAGFTTLALYPDFRAMPCFHQGDGAGNFHTALSFDYIPRQGAFAAVEAPWVYELGEDMEVIWPKVARSYDNAFHVLSCENPASGVAGDPQRHYYIRGEYDPMMFTVNFPDSQNLVAWTMTISGDVAASPVSNRVAVGWLKPWATDPLDTTQHDNDLVIAIAEDGLNFDFLNPINITDWIDPDPTLLPDTLAADKDTFRCYAEMSLFFDYQDYLHVVWDVEAYYHYEGTISRGNSFIYHWSEEWDSVSLVANGWFEYPHFAPGAWNKFLTRPSGSVDPVTGDVYCMYQRYNHPIDVPSQYGYPYQMGDTTDFSAAGWPNGEIWMTKSTDNGYSWAEGINITNTHSPGALPGDCLSELTPSMAPQITNGNAHVFYILDRDAGAVVQTEGTWTLNEAMYHRVPLSEIPESPRLWPVPMHCEPANDNTVRDTIPPPVSVGGHNGMVIDNFELEQNYPNPFNPETSIKYSLRIDGYASLKVYNLQGREVTALLDGRQKAGSHTVRFDASNLPSGVYFYQLKSQGFTQTKKMILMK